MKTSSSRARRRFAAASPSERTTSWLFGGSIPDVCKLAGGDPARAESISAIAERMLERLGSPQRVAEAASATEDSVRARLKRGEEAKIVAELGDGTLDLEALGRADYRDPTW